MDVELALRRPPPHPPALIQRFSPASTALQFRCPVDPVRCGFFPPARDSCHCSADGWSAYYIRSPNFPITRCRPTAAHPLHLIDSVACGSACATGCMCFQRIAIWNAMAMACRRCRAPTFHLALRAPWVETQGLSSPTLTCRSSVQRIWVSCVADPSCRFVARCGARRPGCRCHGWSRPAEAGIVRAFQPLFRNFVFGFGVLVFEIAAMNGSSRAGRCWTQQTRTEEHFEVRICGHVGWADLLTNL